MFEINIHAQVSKFEKTVSALAYKQLPFATAQAITGLAKQISLAEQLNERKVLDRPRPFTENAIGVVGASKARQTAKVYMKDITAKYLEPYEFGGKNVLNSRAVLTPIDAVKDLDQYGDLPRNWMAKLKGRKDIFIGPVTTKSGVINGVWQRSVATGARVSATKMTKKGVLRTARTRAKLNASGRLKLLVKFSDAHDAKQHLGWFVVAQQVIDKNVDKALGNALAKAIETAK